MDCLVARSWVVTLHEGSVAVLDDFRERACGSGLTGRLDGLELLADLLEWVVHSYLEAFEDIEVVLEKFGSRAMAGNLARRNPSSRSSSSCATRSGDCAQSSPPTARSFSR